MAQLTNTQLSNILQALSDITSAGITVDTANFEYSLDKQLEIPDIGRIAYKFETYADIATAALPSYVRAGDYILIVRDETHNQSPSLYMITTLHNAGPTYEYRGTFDLNKFPTSAAVLVAFGKMLGEFQNSLPTYVRSVSGNVVDDSDPEHIKINVKLPKTDEVGLTTVNDTIQLKKKKFNDGFVLSGVTSEEVAYDDVSTLKQKIVELDKKQTELSDEVEDIDVKEYDDIDIGLDDKGRLTLKRRKVGTKNVLFDAEADNIMYDSIWTIKQAIEAILKGTSGGGDITVIWSKPDDETITEDIEHTLTFKMKNFGQNKKVLNAITGDHIQFDKNYTLNEIIQSLIDGEPTTPSAPSGGMSCNCGDGESTAEDFYITGNLTDIDEHGIVYSRGVKSLGVTGAKMTTDGEGNILIDIAQTEEEDDGGDEFKGIIIEPSTELHRPRGGVVYLPSMAGNFDSITGNLVNRANPRNPVISLKIKMGDAEFTPDNKFEITLPAQTQATVAIYSGEFTVSSDLDYVIEHALDTKKIMVNFLIDDIHVDIPYEITDTNNITAHLTDDAIVAYIGKTVNVVVVGGV
jgi:hypothetical protein